MSAVATCGTVSDYRHFRSRDSSPNATEYGMAQLCDVSPNATKYAMSQSCDGSPNATEYAMPKSCDGSQNATEDAMPQSYDGSPNATEDAMPKSCDDSPNATEDVMPQSCDCSSHATEDAMPQLCAFRSCCEEAVSTEHKCPSPIENNRESNSINNYDSHDLISTTSDLPQPANKCLYKVRRVDSRHHLLIESTNCPERFRSTTKSTSSSSSVGEMSNSFCDPTKGETSSESDDNVEVFDETRETSSESDDNVKVFDDNRETSSLSDNVKVSTSDSTSCSTDVVPPLPKKSIKRQKINYEYKPSVRSQNFSRNILQRSHKLDDLSKGNDDVFHPPVTQVTLLIVPAGGGGSRSGISESPSPIGKQQKAANSKLVPVSNGHCIVYDVNIPGNRDTPLTRVVHKHTMPNLTKNITNVNTTTISTGANIQATNPHSFLTRLTSNKSQQLNDFKHERSKTFHLGSFNTKFTKTVSSVQQNPKVQSILLKLKPRSQRSETKAYLASSSSYCKVICNAETKSVSDGAACHLNASICSPRGCSDLEKTLSDGISPVEKISSESSWHGDNNSFEGTRLVRKTVIKRTIRGGKVSQLSNHVAGKIASESSDSETEILPSVSTGLGEMTPLEITGPGEKLQSESSGLGETNNSEITCLDDKNRTDSPCLDEKNRTDSSSLDEKNRTDSPSLDEKNRTDSPSLDDKNRKDSPCLDEKNRTDSPGLDEKNRTDSPSLEKNCTDSPSLDKKNKSENTDVSGTNRTENICLDEKKQIKSTGIDENKQTESTGDLLPGNRPRGKQLLRRRPTFRHPNRQFVLVDYGSKYFIWFLCFV